MKKQGLPKSCRMTERPQFLRLFDNPKVYRTKTFQAFWKESKQSRLGITIKGKVTSVFRSQVKRVIREWFRQVKAEIGKNDVNIVLKASSIKDKNYQVLLQKDLWGWKHGS